MQKWITVAGTVVKGHRVASEPSEVYPYSTIEKQKPYFKELGLDLERYFNATLNISIAPFRFEMVKAEFVFLNVAWTDLHPPEHFSFSSCRVVFHGKEYSGMVYYPHPETKVRHHQHPSVIEVIAEFIPGVNYGERLELVLQDDQIRINKL